VNAGLKGINDNAGPSTGNGRLDKERRSGGTASDKLRVVLGDTENNDI